MTELDVHVASASERAAAHRNVYSQWPTAPTLEEHVKFRLEAPRHAGATWFAGCIDGQVVSSLATYPFGFRVGTEELTGIGIGSVFTVTEHRGRGYAPVLIHGVEEAARKQGIGMSILYSDLDPSYYERLGYLACPAFCGWRATNTPCTTPPVRLKEFSAPSEVDTLASLYDADHGQRRFSVLRDRANWEVAIAHFPHDRFYWIAEDQAKRRGYVRVRVKDDALRIVDTAFLPDAREYEEGVYAALLERARGEGLERLGGWLINSEAGRSFFDVEPRSEEVTMVKPLDWSGTLEAADLSVAAGFCELDHI